MANDDKGLATLGIRELRGFLGAPSVGDKSIIYDASARKVMTRDARAAAAYESATTAAALVNNGISKIGAGTTAVKAYTLAAPVAGCIKYIRNSTTYAHTVTLVSSFLNSSTTLNVLTFGGLNSVAILGGEGTSVYGVYQNTTDVTLST